MKKRGVFGQSDSGNLRYKIEIRKKSEIQAASAHLPVFASFADIGVRNSPPMVFKNVLQFAYFGNSPPLRFSVELSPATSS